MIWYKFEQTITAGFSEIYRNYYNSHILNTKKTYFMKLKNYEHQI